MMQLYTISTLVLLKTLTEITNGKTERTHVSFPIVDLL
jgi:hypothetical protein